MSILVSRDIILMLLKDLKLLTSPLRKLKPREVVSCPMLPTLWAAKNPSEQDWNPELPNSWCNASCMTPILSLLYTVQQMVFPYPFCSFAQVACHPPFLCSPPLPAAHRQPGTISADSRQLLWPAWADFPPTPKLIYSVWALLGH